MDSVRTIRRLHSWGGQGGAHDFEMTDGAIVTLTECEAGLERIAHRIFQGRQRIWDAYQQGQLARETGAHRDSNPWDDALSASHANRHDWYRGWDAGA
jgi:hypothetical protein